MINTLTGVPKNLLGQLSGFYLNPWQKTNHLLVQLFSIKQNSFRLRLILDIIDFSVNEGSLNYMYACTTRVGKVKQAKNDML